MIPNNIGPLPGFDSLRAAGGRWHAKAQMDELEDIATRIDRAVHDLTLSEVAAQGHAQASAQAAINEFRVQVLGELGSVARKVDELLQTLSAVPPETPNLQTETLKTRTSNPETLKP